MKINTRELLLASLFSALMIVSAFIRIPFPLLPVTFQAFVCALAGLLLRPRLAALSMTVYTVLGLAGVPVFAQGGGITYVFNKSFGFILGFIAAAAVISLISCRQVKLSRLRSLAAALAGLLTIYVIGIAYLFLIIRVYTGNTQVGLLFLLSANLPYFIKDLILFAVAAFGTASIIPTIRRSRMQ